MTHIEQELGRELLLVQQPARYVGGEFQLRRKPYLEEDLHVALCFPDLYEIGMSNNAMRILYDLINRIDGVICERVFAPAPDFERVLRDKSYPLYTLENGIALNKVDVLCFTVGYELSATSILNVMDLGKIPLESSQRTDDHPIVLAGGPAITNPLPFSPFFDGVFIGEAEAGLTELLENMLEFKRDNKKRDNIIEYIGNLGNIWTPRNQNKKVVRAIDMDFSTRDRSSFDYFTVPTLKPVQDNGVIEIMRGCPNGCRFCHAGELYKPFRQLSGDRIAERAEQLVNELGYRDITLSSLSSGDHPDLYGIIRRLNGKFASQRVAFSLPSLKVTSFSLPILEQISAVRKSGLTFAIETPLPEWQRSINKVVPIEQVIEIIKEAKKRGWRLAKFYFMVGLPFIDRTRETEAIVEYISRIQYETRIQLNINIGTFIPKPHTAFQWAELMNPEEGAAYLRSLKKAIQERTRRVKVSYHDPVISFIEGMISRGDERVAEIITESFRRGARLDAWDEYLNKDVWLEVIDEQSWPVKETICRAFDTEQAAALPWHSVELASTHRYLLNEYEQARKCIESEVCDNPCPHYCGVCRPSAGIVPSEAEMTEVGEGEGKAEGPTEKVKLLLRYRKTGTARYHSHIHVMHLFEKSFQRAGIPLAFTEGYNPKPIMEFAQPLPIGITGESEYMTATVIRDKNELEPLNLPELCIRINTKLSEGFEITDAHIIRNNLKKSLTASYFAADYRITGIDSDAMELMRKLERTYANFSLILADASDPSSVTVRVADTVKYKTEHPGSEAEIGSGNLMKLVDETIPKYTFLSRYETCRIALYADNMVELKDYFTFQEVF